MTVKSRAELHPGWTRVQCVSCSGYGLKSLYTMGGTDFDGATECRQCDGNGVQWRSPNGRYAVWPGGRFVGRDPEPER